MHWNKTDYDTNVCETNIEGIFVRMLGVSYPEKEAYAIRMAELYSEREEEILVHIVNGISEYYENKFNLTEEEMKEMLGDVRIDIFSDRYGALVWLNHSFDEHIIECEFFNELQLSQSVTLDG